jgi:Uma2 family endonuclease
MATTHPTSNDSDLDDFWPRHPGRRMTEEEFEAWYPRFEKARVEWVDGDVIVMAPANIDHSDLNVFLVGLMRDVAEHHDLGRVLVDYATRFHARGRLVRLVPDVAFIARDRLRLVQRTYLDGPPDLAVEIVSPDSAARDTHDKFLDYQAAGVREYWIVDPLSETLTAYRLAGGSYQRIPEADGRVASDVLPGFYLRPEWLWRRPLPKAADVRRELGV